MTPGRLLFLILLISILPAGMNALPASAASELRGAGATFPQPFYEMLFTMYRRGHAVKVRYEGVGSGEGLRLLATKTVDFAGTDKMARQEATDANSGAILNIPTCVGAVAVVYNVPGNPRLRFTPDIIADIFLGRIKRWSDPRIAAVNRPASLPDIPIAVVYRVDASGTTFIFSDYLAKTSREWNDSIGRGTSLKWPAGQGARGNPGVAGLVGQIPGSIGYAELVYAIGNKMTFGALRNRSGQFVMPTVKSVTAAASIDLASSADYSLTDTPVPDGYPISGFTWIAIYREQNYGGRPREKAEELVSLLSFIVRDGQKHAPSLHYAPLPKNARRSADTLLGKVTHGGVPVYRHREAAGK
ncbi:MAG: Phosphate-binding protein PstS precursor [Syntrophorhabdus sp. PtaB.Bin047]|jgi:phosphate transport system substrate-binding protein|nr:MAG: Phosphate-binding protein PstS precursor [Syntrophorhabdus sp. PtaB.Bin047]